VLTCSLLEQRIGFLLYHMFKMGLFLWYNFTNNQEEAAWVQPSPDNLPSPSHCPVLTLVFKVVSIPITQKVEDHSNGVLF
jgi:hypothetical protein